MKFNGDITDRMTGFYRNKYTTPDGKEVRYGASTQFEVNVEFEVLFLLKFENFSLRIADEHFHVGMNRISKRHLI